MKATGLTLGFQDARAGRALNFSSTNGIFECYGGTPLGKNLGAALSPDNGGWGTCAQANNGILGNTVAQDIASVDLMLVQLGTNDVYGEVLGSIADSSSVNTIYGNIRYIIESLQTAKPNMRIIWIEPPQVGDPTVTNTATGLSRAQQIPAIAAAIDSVCAQYGIPIVRMFSESGINSKNWSIYLNSDLLHPSTLGFQKVYVPMIVNRINQFSPGS